LDPPCPRDPRPPGPPPPRHRGAVQRTATPHAGHRLTDGGPAEDLRPSALAHGDRGVLKALACRQGDPDAMASWARGVGFLASAVLDLAERQGSLVVELQRRVVVPAELDFLDLTARGWTLGPEHLVSRVIAGLDEERRARPAP
jgi:hypothetical protein